MAVAARQPLLFPLPDAVEVARKRRSVPKATRADEYERLLTAAPTQDYRDLFILMRWAGLRVSEAVGLRWELVDLDGLQLRVTGKGNVERYIDLLPEAETMLRRRRAELTGPASLVFAGGSEDGTISPRAVQRVMQRLRAALAIPKERCTPHKLRHSFATNALNDGAPIHVVSEQLGHASVQTTSCYLHALPGQLRRVYEARAGRN